MMQVIMIQVITIQVIMIPVIMTQIITIQVIIKRFDNIFDNEFENLRVIINDVNKGNKNGCNQRVTKVTT